MLEQAKQQAESAGLALVETSNGLVLTDGIMELAADFSRMISRVNPNKVHQELLVKAAKIKGTPTGDLLVVDATAGLGEDSLLLAAAGLRVLMFERDPLIATLLEDALVRGARDPRLAPLVSRMELRKEDSIAALSSGDISASVVLLDPMFPARTKSASVKKKFQLIHAFEAPCTDEAELLAAAEAAKPRRIVIKRPPKGPFLAERKPSYSLAGKAVRYDVLTFAAE
ncbi:MAG: class I SAM-dependent methyltransferase [Eggerthellales bacterium]|nr:class I SAM-dependent methyltransferase [Eggerthellales bacterium]